MDGQGRVFVSDTATSRIYVLDGELVLVTDAGEQVLTPGMVAGFPAGQADGHRDAEADLAQVARLDGHSSRVESVSWHPAGDRIASAGRDRTVKVWDPEARALVASFDCGSRLCAVRWSPDGTQLVALDVDGVVHLWDAGR